MIWNLMEREISGRWPNDSEQTNAALSCWWASNPIGWVVTGALLDHHLSNKRDTEHSGGASSLTLGPKCDSWNMHVWYFQHATSGRWKNVVAGKTAHLNTLQPKGVDDGKEMKSLRPENWHPNGEKQGLTELRVTCNKATVWTQSYLLISPWVAV